MIIRLAWHNFYGDFSDPFRCKPRDMVPILSDSYSKMRVSQLDFGNGLGQLIIGDISLDPGYDRYKRKRRTRK
jgi:hypothetical protein